MNQQLEKGIEDPKGARVIFSNQTTLSKSSKDNHRSGMRLMTDLDLNLKGDLSNVEGFTLTLHNKATTISIQINEEQLQQMLDYVKLNKNARYSMAIQDFVYSPIKENESQ